MTDELTGGSSRPGIAPSSLLPTPPLLSSPLPEPGSASVQSHPPLLRQTEGAGLYPGREQLGGFPLWAQAGDKTEEWLQLITRETEENQKHLYLLHQYQLWKIKQQCRQVAEFSTVPWKTLPDAEHLSWSHQEPDWLVQQLYKHSYELTLWCRQLSVSTSLLHICLKRPM